MYIEVFSVKTPYLKWSLYFWYLVPSSFKYMYRNWRVLKKEVIFVRYIFEISNRTFFYFLYFPLFLSRVSKWNDINLVSLIKQLLAASIHHIHGLRTPNKGINQRYLKNLKLGRCGRQNMLRPYLKLWDWIFGRAVKAISSLGVRSPWTTAIMSEKNSTFLLFTKRGKNSLVCTMV